jgi:hypothetical protein
VLRQLSLFERLVPTFRSAYESFPVLLGLSHHRRRGDADLSVYAIGAGHQQRHTHREWVLQGRQLRCAHGWLDAALSGPGWCRHHDHRVLSGLCGRQPARRELTRHHTRGVGPLLVVAPDRCHGQQRRTDRQQGTRDRCDGPRSRGGDRPCQYRGRRRGAVFSNRGRNQASWNERRGRVRIRGTEFGGGTRVAPGRALRRCQRSSRCERAPRARGTHRAHRLARRPHGAADTEHLNPAGQRARGPTTSLHEKPKHT